MVYDHRRTPAAAEAGLPANASGALRVGDWKLFVGPAKQASWFGATSLHFLVADWSFTVDKLQALQMSTPTVELCYDRAQDTLRPMRAHAVRE